MKLRFVLAILCMLAAGGAGLVSWPRLPPFLRLLVLFCLGGAGVVAAGCFIRPNHLLFNAFMPVETALLLGTAAGMLQGRRQRLILGVLTVLFGMAYALNLSRSGWDVFANYAMAIKCAVVVVVYLMVLFQVLVQAAGVHRRWLILLCLSLLLYHACSVPVWGMLRYLNTEMPGVAAQLFTIIRVLSAVQYLMIGACFLSFKAKRMPDAPPGSQQ